MAQSIAEQVVDFYQALFKGLFTEPFSPLVSDPLKRNAMRRQIEEMADAASQSLTRYLTNERATIKQVAQVLACLDGMRVAVLLEDIANPRLTPENIIEAKLQNVSCPA